MIKPQKRTFETCAIVCLTTFLLGSRILFASDNHKPAIDIRMEGKILATGGDTDITFHFRMSGTNDASLIRYQYKLDGVQPNWQERSDVMRLVALFHDSKAKLLRMQEVTFKNTSAGWTGDVETSPMIPGRMIVDVPEAAASMLVTLTSAGPAAGLGVIALGDLRVTGIDAEGINSLLYQLAFTTNKVTGSNNEPINASVGGINRSMAKVLHVNQSPGNYALAILDNDKTSHADWETTWIPIDPRKAKRVILEWSISHSIGLANQSSVRYPTLTPGRYCFRLKPIFALGSSLGDEQSYPFQLYMPFWEETWFQGLALLAILSGVFGATRYYYRQRSRRIIERLEQLQAVERERMRIARDIHDDLGSTLAQISMLSQPLSASANLDDAKQVLEQINSATVDMSVTMDEIVWTLNPTKDRLDHLLNYFDNFAQEFLRFSQINFRFECPTALPQTELSSTVRHNLFLAYKEALANAVKYSGCKELRVRYEPKDNGFTLSVIDDGCGFEIEKTPSLGNGLCNMRQRLADIGGECRIESTLGRGTHICFVVEV
ncbi:MAG: ATP-binding protein [bacterium]